jgi:hypothetical protein
MRIARNKRSGLEIKVYWFFVTTHGWEYFVIDPYDPRKDVFCALVCGLEQEIGSFSMNEVKSYIWENPTLALQKLLPPDGYEWVGL